MGIRSVAGVSSLMLLAMCARAIDQQLPPPPGSETPPQSLAMGASKSRMTFFVTSKGLGNGADLTELDNLDGADAHCQALANAEGAGGQRSRSDRPRALVQRRSRARRRQSR